jgi:hypothetical protein
MKYLKSYLEVKSKTQYQFVELNKEQISEIEDICLELLDYGTEAYFNETGDLWIQKSNLPEYNEDDEEYYYFKYTHEITEVIERIKDYLKDYDIFPVFRVDGILLNANQNPKKDMYGLIELHFIKKLLPGESPKRGSRWIY